ncbi:uncharacterized protein F4807DRAFT_462459 [Annulohypoxylon truncatum]|uniref:uncharacterized protein n=1 Tax=Annulohypoxylon truncatum TaxID=327061 RepID=UPI0020076C1B|nr:uncharacterized protein F4807DRAFT_462459 [Annulohypoxylon truncatum]KAI1207654.1 hypothetical protein F4807DRAFT_462459 [Annulohypoxylon truncatum]
MTEVDWRKLLGLECPPRILIQPRVQTFFLRKQEDGIYCIRGRDKFKISPNDSRLSHYLGDERNGEHIAKEIHVGFDLGIYHELLSIRGQCGREPEDQLIKYSFRCEFLIISHHEFPDLKRSEYGKLAKSHRIGFTTWTQFLTEGLRVVLVEKKVEKKSRPKAELMIYMPSEFSLIEKLVKVDITSNNGHVNLRKGSDERGTSIHVVSTHDSWPLSFAITYSGREILKKELHRGSLTYI